MQAWWSSLLVVEQIFAAVAISASVILVFQLILTLIGLGGSGADVDMDSDVSGLGDSSTDFDFDGDLDDFADSDSVSEIGDGGLRLFTFRGIIAFLTIFGWCGLACLKSEWSVLASVLTAVVAGFIAMVVIALLMRMAIKLQFNGTTDLKNAIGKSAMVYIRIPAQRRGTGKISVLVQEKLIEVDAVTDETTDLLTSSEVIILGISTPNTVIVASKH